MVFISMVGILEGIEMEPILLSKEYILVIDTDKIAYDFYKELCSYCTGFTHESARDNLFSDMFDEEVEEANLFAEMISDRLDDDGYLAPSCVWLNKRYRCNDVGRYELLDENNFEEYSCPAPMSIGIFLSQEPEQRHLDVIKQRAKQFFEKVWKPAGVVAIEGFRLIVHTKYGEERIID